MIKHSGLISVIYLASIALMDGIAMFFLPPEMVVQIHADGTDGTILPTWIALGIVFVIAAAIAFQLYSQSKKNSDTKRWIFGAVIIFALNIILILFNL